MSKLRYLDQALEDLIHIHRYIADESGSKKTARNFCDKLRAQCRNISSFPGKMGRQRPELRENLRSMAHGNYLIFFIYSDASIDIVTIIEGHRDIDTLFYEGHMSQKENH